MALRGWFLCAILLGVLAAAVPAAADDPTDTIAKILQAEDTATYSSFLEKVALDQKRTPLERNLAAQAIGRIGDPEGAIGLFRVLLDKTMDQAVVCAAIGDLWANTPARAYNIVRPPAIIVELLAVALRSPSVEARAAAFTALSQIFPGDFVNFAQDVQNDLAVGRLVDKNNALLFALLRVAAAEKLTVEHEPNDIIAIHNKHREAIFAYGLTHTNPDVAYFAAYFAGQKPALDLDLSALLTDALSNPNPLVRAAALRALARRRAGGNPAREAAKKMLAGGTTQEKIAAAEAVVALFLDAEALELLKTALAAAGTASATSVHQALLENIGRLKGPAAPSFLWDIAQQKVPYRRIAGVAAAKAGASAQAFALSAQDFAGSDEDAAYYIDLLAAAGVAARLNWLAEGDGVPERFARSLPIRQRIVAALVFDADGKARPQAIKDHPGWMKDPDPRIRSLAFASAGATADQQYIKMLYEGFRKALKERDPRPAIAALDAVSLLTEMKTPNVSADFIAPEWAREALDGPSLPVRRKAVEVLYKVTHEMHRKELFGQAATKSDADYRRLAALVVNGGVASMTAKTTKGDIRFVVRRDLAPLNADNFIVLATAGFYDNLSFFGVAPAVLAPTGDPLGNGSGGPGYFVRSEFDAMPFGAGALGMIAPVRDMAGSQFFFTALPTPDLDGRRTAFGRVADDASLAAVASLAEGDKLLSVRLDSAAAAGK